jgi:HK97 family phage major capsid protein
VSETAQSLRIEKLRKVHSEAVEKVEAAGAAYDALPATADGAVLTASKDKLDNALNFASKAKEELDRETDSAEARSQHKFVPLSGGGVARIGIDEPDMYAKNGRSFLNDLYFAQVKGNAMAQERINRHQAYEVEKYSVATGTLGGIVPPQYLVEDYAKAQRFGRILADQVRHDELPEQGMSVVIPRLTQGTSAAIQASESATVSTQDPTEVDLTVNVRTIAGYSPVSRQTLERAAYSESILFEDLIARYFAALDVQLISGSGSSGQHLGLLNVAGISTATISSFTAANAWSALVGETGLMAQVNQWAATVGGPADRMLMHPRRWGAFLNLLDSQNRPLVVPEASGSAAVNAMGYGDPTGYGQVGRLGGLPVFIDANIPTNLGAGTNEDRIFVFASQAPILFERTGDPITLGFEQQAGSSLQVQLVCYGYSAFAGGRFPAAVGVASGAGLS